MGAVYVGQLDKPARENLTFRITNILICGAAHVDVSTQSDRTGTPGIQPARAVEPATQLHDLALV